jgi:hypothetical protein
LQASQTKSIPTSVGTIIIRYANKVSDQWSLTLFFCTPFYPGNLLNSQMIDANCDDKNIDHPLVTLASQNIQAKAFSANLNLLLEQNTSLASQPDLLVRVTFHQSILSVLAIVVKSEQPRK